ncbi:MAG: hypothetical protein E7448_01475 [Ruminococcaceae bacterium]|nr:hypothetical protein [Oscillospiraceae bacterium]
MLQTKNRIQWIDIAKAITILLVVLGHTLRDGAVQRMVYGVHLPAFFLLAGMTCKTTNIAGRLRKDFLRIMVPYYVFGLASILIFAVLGSVAADQLAMDVDTSFGKNLVELLVMNPKGGRMKFNLPLWFLPCLFAVKCLYYGLVKLFRDDQKKILIASLVLGVIGFVYTGLKGPSLPFNFSVALKMMAFFAFGQWIVRMISDARVRFFGGPWNCIPGILMLIAAGLVGWLAPKVNYSGDTFPDVLAFLVTSVSGSFGICLVSMAIEKSKILEYVGKNTLAILVMHKFPVLLFQTVGPLKAPLTLTDDPVGILVAVVVAVVSIAVCLAVGWFIHRFLPFLFGDFSCFKRKK